MTEPEVYKYPEGTILIFARAPVPGTVKTRLAADIGNVAATDVYRQCLRATVTMVAGAQLAPAALQVTPDTRHPMLLSLASDHGIGLKTQQGADLGERMFGALQAALRCHDFAVLIGTDCPVMTMDYLDQACRALRSGTDIVLGPAEDGGYVLLGARVADERMFTDIPWGSHDVLALTRERLKLVGMRHAELAPLWDIDTLDDLDRLRRWSGQLP